MVSREPVEEWVKVELEILFGHPDNVIIVGGERFLCLK